MFCAGQPVCGCQLESAGSGSSSAASMLLGLPSRLSSSAVAAAAAAAAAGMAAPAGPGASVGLGLGLGLYNPYAAAQEPTFLTDQSPFYAAAVSLVFSATQKKTKRLTDWPVVC